jgi:hypothetical protein
LRVAKRDASARVEQSQRVAPHRRKDGPSAEARPATAATDACAACAPTRISSHRPAVATALGAALVVVRTETERRVRDDFASASSARSPPPPAQALRRETAANEVDALRWQLLFPHRALEAPAGRRSRLRCESREDQLRDANLRLRSLLPSLVAATRHTSVVAALAS